MPLGGWWIRAWRELVNKECVRASLSTSCLNASWWMVDSCFGHFRDACRCLEMLGNAWKCLEMFGKALSYVLFRGKQNFWRFSGIFLHGKQMCLEMLGNAWKCLENRFSTLCPSDPNRPFQAAEDRAALSVVLPSRRGPRRPLLESPEGLRGPLSLSLSGASLPPSVPPPPSRVPASPHCVPL